MVTIYLTSWCLCFLFCEVGMKVQVEMRTGCVLSSGLRALSWRSEFSGLGVQTSTAALVSGHFIPAFPASAGTGLEDGTFRSHRKPVEFEGDSGWRERPGGPGRRRAGLL